MQDYVWIELMWKNIVIGNVLMRGYMRNGFFDNAMDLYSQMLPNCIHPNNFTFPCILNACTYLSALQKGKEVHENLIRSGLQSGIYVANNLVSMYAKCGGLEDTHQVFDKIPYRDVAL